MSSITGAQIIAKALFDLGVTVVFGIVGIPVVEVADEATKLGIRFLAFRNEQSASYAASAYGYITGRPGVCLVVGGPGVLHAMAGVGNASANHFPMLLLAGSSETHLTGQGAFQEMDAISLLTPHVKAASRPPSVESIPDVLENAYRMSFYGRAGPTFVDLPADLIKSTKSPSLPEPLPPVPSAPQSAATQSQVLAAARALRAARAPLIIIGKGAAYAQAEEAIRDLIDGTQMPFLPTPMGKGVIDDGHPLNMAAARSAALKQADVVLLLGARLNWILHFGAPPKWRPDATFIQVDVAPSELGRNAGAAELGLAGDVGVVAEQLGQALSGWTYGDGEEAAPGSYISTLREAAGRNEEKAAKLASKETAPGATALTFQRAFELIKAELHGLSPPNEAGIVYVAEGANTMDISRSLFPVSEPRLRLDAGTYATMGVGPGYAIAAHAAYNPPPPAFEIGAQRPPPPPHKKIVCLEGDSAFGFSLAEIETMARAGMDILVFVMNNGGVYHGDADDKAAWDRLREQGGLRSTSLGFETRYEKLAEMCGGQGWFVRSEDELRRAVREGFESTSVCVVNVCIESGKGSSLSFGWQASGAKAKESKL